jgi:hypothetical protein
LALSNNLGALESFPEKIPRVINEEPIELPTHKVYNWYPDTIKAVVEGSVIM